MCKRHAEELLNHNRDKLKDVKSASWSKPVTKSDHSNQKTNCIVSFPTNHPQVVEPASAKTRSGSPNQNTTILSVTDQQPRVEAILPRELTTRRRRSDSAHQITTPVANSTDQKAQVEVDPLSQTRSTSSQLRRNTPTIFTADSAVTAACETDTRRRHLSVVAVDSSAPPPEVKDTACAVSDFLSPTLGGGGGGALLKVLLGAKETAGSGEKGTAEGGAGAGGRRPSGTLYTMEEVSNHCGQDSCWIILWDHVYDVTPFIREHPGGEDIIYEHSGHDATFAFRDVGHSNDALLLMMQYRIGILVDEERIFKRHKIESLSG